MCYVSTASFDGETALKSRIPLEIICKDEAKIFQATLTTDVPSNAVSVFNGSYVRNDNCKRFFKLENTLLKGMRINNTDFAIVASIYTGMDTRLLQTVPHT